MTKEEQVDELTNKLLAACNGFDQVLVISAICNVLVCAIRVTDMDQDGRRMLLQAVETAAAAEAHGTDKVHH